MTLSAHAEVIMHATISAAKAHLEFIFDLVLEWEWRRGGVAARNFGSRWRDYGVLLLRNWLKHNLDRLHIDLRAVSASGRYNDVGHRAFSITGL